jgi:hypothetical protein
MTKIILKTTILATAAALAFGFVFTSCKDDEVDADPTVITITGISSSYNGKDVLLWIFPPERAGDESIANIAMADGKVSNGQFLASCVKQGDSKNWHETGEYCILINFSFNQPGWEKHWYTTGSTPQKYNITSLSETIPFSKFKKL